MTAMPLQHSCAYSLEGRFEMPAANYKSSELPYSAHINPTDRKLHQTVNVPDVQPILRAR